MQIKIPPEAIKMALFAKIWRDIADGKDPISALRGNIYMEEYMSAIEEATGKSIEEIESEIKEIDDPGERLILGVERLILPILPKEMWNDVKERAEKAAEMIRTTKSRKIMTIKIMSALFGIDEAAIEAFLSLVP